MQNNYVYTDEQLMSRLKFFIGIVLSLTLFGIVFVVLYSLIFVTQPLNAISPIDQKFFELIVPIATFLTGTLSGIMLAGNDKESQKLALQAATRPTSVTPAPVPTPSFAPAPQQSFSFLQNIAPINNPVPAAPAAQVVTGFGGKPMPVQPEQPIL